MVSRAFVYTLFPQAEDYSHLQPPIPDDELAFYIAQDEESWSHPDVRYAIHSVEACPSSGRLHLQGYTELHRPVRASGLRVLLPVLASACIQERRGTRDEARDYARKEETRVLGKCMPRAPRAVLCVLC